MLEREVGGMLRNQAGDQKGGFSEEALLLAHCVILPFKEYKYHPCKNSQFIFLYRYMCVCNALMNSVIYSKFYLRYSCNLRIFLNSYYNFKTEEEENNPPHFPSSLPVCWGYSARGLDYRCSQHLLLTRWRRLMGSECLILMLVLNLPPAVFFSLKFIW